MKPIRITFYQYAIVEIIAERIFYDRHKFFEKVKDKNGEPIKIYDHPEDPENSMYDFVYKQVKRISKKQCIKWIKGALGSIGSGDAYDFTFLDIDYKLAEELIEKYNL
tara:strand:- start:14616 stop:14939 length:324 start_codon:yes stop_codon:yes gene_type:complete